MGRRYFKLNKAKFLELEKKKVLIGIPHNLDFIHNRFRLRMDMMKSFIGGEWITNVNDTHINNRNNWTIVYEKRFPIEIARNEIVSMAINNNYDYVFMLDSDMDNFPPDLIYYFLDKMTTYDIKVLSGLAYCRNGVLDPKSKKLLRAPAVFHKNEKGQIANWRDLMPGSGLITEDGLMCGSACMMVDVNVYKKIELPYYHWEMIYDKENNQISFENGEDIYFCRRAQEEGFKVYIDTNILIGHLGLCTFPYEYYNLPTGYLIDK